MDPPISHTAQNERFTRALLPYRLDAYRMARWLLRDDDDAEDAVQEAYLAAFRFFANFQEDNARAWMLTVVRNTCYSWLRKHRSDERVDSFDEDSHSLDDCGEPTSGVPGNPEILLLRSSAQERMVRAIGRLPASCRQTLAMREIDEMSYREIAVVAGVPIGTVMSRLARARCLLRLMLRDLEA